MDIRVVGGPCGYHGSYTFYKGVKITFGTSGTTTSTSDPASSVSSSASAPSPNGKPTATNTTSTNGHSSSGDIPGLGGEAAAAPDGGDPPSSDTAPKHTTTSQRLDEQKEREEPSGEGEEEGESGTGNTASECKRTDTSSSSSNHNNNNNNASVSNNNSNSTSSGSVSVSNSGSGSSNSGNSNSNSDSNGNNSSSTNGGNSSTNGGSGGKSQNGIQTKPAKQTQRKCVSENGNGVGGVGGGVSGGSAASSNGTGSSTKAGNNNLCGMASLDRDNQRPLVLALGDCIPVRPWSDSPIACLAELRMVWRDRNEQCLLIALRLYFLPENTPSGRNCHGEDEVLAISDKVILRAEDLLNWIDTDQEWTWGLLTMYNESSAKDCLGTTRHLSKNSSLDFGDVDREKHMG